MAVLGRDGGHPSTQFTWSTGSGTRTPYQEGASTGWNSNHFTSDRSLPSDVGSHGSTGTTQRAYTIGRRVELTLRSCVTKPETFSRKSKSPDPPSCPASDGDDERSGGQVEQSEQSHPRRVVYRQQRLPSHYQTTGRARCRPFRHMPQQETANIRQPVSGSTSSSNRRIEHGLEQSFPGLRIPSNAYSPQGTSEDQDVIMHHQSDSASLANSIMVSRPRPSIHSNPVHDFSVPGTSVPSGGSPDVVPQEFRNVPLPRFGVVRNMLTDRGFSSRAAERISIPQRNSTRLVYEGKWSEFCPWCRRQQSDPLAAAVPVIADFLMDLFDRNPPLTVSTINGYISSIAATLPHGSEITNTKELRNIIWHRKACHQGFLPKWSLQVVLNYLIGRPFEPLLRSSMENLILKTVFFIALASHLTQKTSRAPAKFTIKSLVQFAGHDLPDYKDRTKDPAVRWGRRKLFIPFNSTDQDIKSVHMDHQHHQESPWDADEETMTLANVTAHEVCSIATSWAVFNNAPFDDMMQATDWTGRSTFQTFYSRAMAAHTEGLYDLGPLVVAQNVIGRPPLETQPPDHPEG